MFKKDLALNELQWLICHKTKPNNCYFFLHYSAHDIYPTFPPSQMKSF